MSQEPATFITPLDLYLFNEGTNTRAYKKLGAHPIMLNGVTGTHFAVWAPSARYVAVIGDFNGWDAGQHPLRPLGESGVWAGFVPGLGPGALYKYHIASRWHGYRVDKADPMGFLHECPPKTASVVWDLDYTWGDGDWMAKRHTRQSLRSPISIYEVHLGSWMRVPEDHYRSLNYRELAGPLIEHVKRMGFTHVEFLPLTEHPFFASWGYQTTGYFAPTARYGTPQDFMYLIDQLHQNDIGVFLDWVPSHFPSDQHGLGYFDGTHLYEHADPRQGYHPDWNSLIFNYGRKEVQSFLLSSALFWLDVYHIDGIRVDAVASMLYLDYSRKAGEWIPNHFGGNENFEAIDFLRRLNTEIYAAYPDVQTFAEESTAFTGVSRPVYTGGLGFGFKWDMGWMHDTLQYMSRDPVFRKYHQGDLLFRMIYAYSENFVLPLSHDEVVHGKGSLLSKMPGDDWQKFANLRAMYGYMYAMPGKKLLFMGSEIAQRNEWNHDSSIDWHLRQYEPHRGVERWVADLNRLYRSEPALYTLDTTWEGFQWIDFHDHAASVMCMMRKSGTVCEEVVIICNFTPVPRHHYRFGLPHGGRWRELLNSDSTYYGGSGVGNAGHIWAEALPWQGQPYSAALTIPPLGVLYLKWAGS
jgi:1,4-alpha-glucan branching enzyme